MKNGPSQVRTDIHCVSRRRGSTIAALLFSLAASSIWAQTPALTPATSEGAAPRNGTAALTVPASPASAASASRPGRRYLSADEKRQSATTPGDLRPTDPVVPQLRIPIGRRLDADSASSSAAPGGIDDDAARCRAQANPADRARCGAGAQKLLPKPSLRP